MTKQDVLLRSTRLLDFGSKAISQLVLQRGWDDLSVFDRIGAAYGFVRDEILFGYNCQDDLPASEVLHDGYGQCNTKAILLMALLRRLGIPCRLHGFTIHKALQRGVIPEFIYPLAPNDILHSWVEIRLEGRWVDLEGFIIDRGFLKSIQDKFAAEKSQFCGYGIGTENLSDPPVEWGGCNTYVQKTGINRDLGVFEDPDSFYARHRQQMNAAREILYRYLVRHLMNFRVRSIRRGRIPAMPLKHAFQKHASVVGAGSEAR